MKENVVFISSESTSTLDHGASSLCSSTLEKLKGFACPMSESSVVHGATFKEKNTLHDVHTKVPHKKSLDDMEQHSDKNKLGKLEEENEKEEGRYWMTDSEQVQYLVQMLLL